MDQGPGLIEPCCSERDAEFDRRQCDAFANAAVLCVVRKHRLPPRLIIGSLLQFGDQTRQDIILDCLMIGGDIARGLAIKVAFTDFERVFAKPVSDLFDDALRCQYTLWTTKAAERGVGYTVGFDRLRSQPHVRIKIAIVGVKQRPVGHRP